MTYINEDEDVTDLWDYELDDDLTLHNEDCPACGECAIINAQVECGTQFVAHEKENQVEPDDGPWGQKLLFARCGHCGAILADE